MSFRASAASRGICNCSSNRDRCATCFHAEAQRSAEAQRTARGFEMQEPPHGTSPSTTPRENDFGIGIQPLLAPRPCSVLPMLRGSAWDAVETAKARAQHFTPRRGGAEHYSGSRSPCVARRLSIHNSKKTRTVESAFSLYRRRGLSESSAPLRPSAPLRQNTLRDGADPCLGARSRCEWIPTFRELDLYLNDASAVNGAPAPT